MIDEPPKVAGKPQRFDDRSVQKAAKTANDAPDPHPDVKVVADRRYVDFMNSIRQETVNAQTKFQGEKYLTLRTNADGQVIIQHMGINGGQGGSLTSKIHNMGVDVVVHEHYEGLIQPPNGADHSSAKFEDVPDMVLTSDGKHLYELDAIPRQNGKGRDFEYRDVTKPDKPGPYKPMEGAK